MLDINENEIYPIIKKLIDEDDLESLIKLGAPTDEYAYECREITQAIIREGPVTFIGLAKIIRLVFFYKFNSWTIEDMPLLTPYLHTAYEMRNRLPASCIKGR